MFYLRDCHGVGHCALGLRVLFELQTDSSDQSVVQLWGEGGCHGAATPAVGWP